MMVFLFIFHLVAAHNDDLFNLAVKQARRLNLEEKTEVKEKIDKILYEAFLKESLKGKTLTPTEKEIRAVYDKKPLLRLRQLILKAKSKEDKDRAKRISETVKKQLGKKSFTELVLEFSEDSYLAAAGDLDFRGPDKLPTEIYEKALLMKKGQVSEPFIYENYLFMVELMDKKKFEDLEETYVKYLSYEIEKEKEKEYLLSLLKNLKGNS